MFIFLVSTSEINVESGCCCAHLEGVGTWTWGPGPLLATLGHPARQVAPAAERPALWSARRSAQSAQAGRGCRSRQASAWPHAPAAECPGGLGRAPAAPSPVFPGLPAQACRTQFLTWGSGHPQVREGKPAIFSKAEPGWWPRVACSALLQTCLSTFSAPSCKLVSLL